MTYLLRTKSITNFFDELKSERIIAKATTLVERRKENVGKCCCCGSNDDEITCYKCNRRTNNNEQFSQINYLNKCSMDSKENRKFLTTKIDDTTVSIR